VYSSNPTVIATHNNINISNTPKHSPIHILNPSSNFIGLAQVGNGTHWLKAGERGLADFLPILSLGGDIKAGLIDYIIKIVGVAVAFGLIAIALRRRFERKYTLSYGYLHFYL
jgi:hypothetical protein